ncbi:dihydrolipoamide acetyltransferase family protein [soil metagenome]
MSQFLLPDVGEGLTEAEIVRWLVAVGDTVAVNDVICEIETAKSIVELPSPYAGQVTALLVEVGQTVAVGSPIINIGSTLVGYGPKETVRRRRGAVATAEPQQSGRSGVLAKPPVRWDARSRGIDLATVAPTGPHGDVTVADLDRSTVAEPSAAVAGRTTVEPLKGVRRAMAEAMVSSAFTAPHATVWTTADLTAALGSDAAPLVGLAHSVAHTLVQWPLLNSVFEPDRVVLRHWVNLGIAVAGDRGLVVPVIADADLLDVSQMDAAIRQIVDTARAGRTQPSDLAGGTFTITNVGTLGVDGGTPIINPGQSAILAMGQIARRPWVVEVDGEERLAIRHVGTLALSFDHRHIDGAAAAGFLRAVIAHWTAGSAAFLVDR